MKLKKAIEVLDNAAAEMGRPQDPDLWDAMYIGVEAIIAVQNARQGLLIDNVGKLPGETEE